MSYSSEVLADSPIAYWKLDDTKAVDASGNGNDFVYGAGVTVGGTALLSDGGTSVHGDGSHVIAFRNAVGTGLTGGNVTLEAWVTIPAGNVNGPIINVGNETANGWAMGVGGTTFDNAGKQLIFATNAIAWNVSGYNFSTGTHHVMAVRGSGNTVTCYVDGSSVATVTLSTPNAASATTHVGGSQSRALSSTVQVDNVAIYASALSSGRVTAHYNSGSGDNTAVSADSPVVWLKLDESSTGTVSEADSSGNGHSTSHQNAPTLIQSSLLGDGSGYSVLYNGSTQFSSAVGASWMATPSGLTVEARIRPNSGVLSAGGFIASQWSGGVANVWIFGVTSAAKLTAQVVTGGTTRTATGATTLTAGTNYTVALRWTSGGNLEVFLNGVSDGSTAASGSLASSSTQAIDIGRAANANGSGLSWNGLIDEVSITGSSLSNGRMTTRHAAAISAGTQNGAASLTASSTLTATAFATRPAAAALTATSTLTADGFIGTPTISGAASLTASSSLTASVVVTRSAVAALTASSTLTTAGQITAQQAVATMTATCTLTATASGAVALSATASLYAASALFVDAGASKAASATLTTTSTLTVAATAYTPWVEPNDPRTGKPQYRLIIAHRDGTRYGEITDATTSPIEDGVGVGATFSFTLATADPKMALVNIPATQVQVWRGSGIQPDGGARPEFRGPMVKATDDKGGATTIDCRDPMWYLESGRRVVGAIPKRDLLVNGSFATGESPWAGGFEPDSIPAAQPVRSVIDVDFFGTRMKALQISGVDKVVTVTKEVKTEAVFVPNSATYLPGGDAAIRAVANLMPKTGTLTVRVDGFTADNRINGDPGDGMALSLARANAAKGTILSVRPAAVVTTAGYGYYQQIPGGLAANRRVVVTWNGVQEASGHKQYEGQTLTITQPVAKKAYLPLTAVIWVKITKWIGPSKDSRGIYIQIVDPAKPKVIVDSGVFQIDEKTPRDRWIRMEASLENGVPADGVAYQAQVRLYPPAGTALFTRGGLYPGDQLAFFDVDQALIIKGLVEHAQDTTIGKGALGITTRCQPTGLTRTRQYPYDERMEIDTAINEIAALYAGPEVVMEVTDSAQTVVTYHPRQGVATSEVLNYPGNLVTYEAPTDTRDAASSIILQADGSGADREEGYASDVAALDGLMLERVISTENETPVTELQEGATEALARYKQPRPAIWVTVDPSRTGAVLAKVRQGDTARLVIDPAGIDATHRRVKRRLHFSDVLELMMAPEG